MNKIFTTNEELKNIKNVNELLNKANLNWEVEQQDVFLEGGIQIPNTAANVRTDNGTVLGIVTERYAPVQNTDAFDFVQDLTDSITFENAGEAQDGRFVYIQADLDERYLTDLEREVECKLVFTNGHDGKTAVKANIIPIIDGKVFNINLNNAKRSFNANHTKKIGARMKVAKNTLDLAKSYLGAVMQETVNLSRISVTETQIQAFIEALFPITKELSDRSYNSIIDKRNDFRTRVKTNNAFGLVMAAADFVENFEPQRRTADFEINRYMNLLSGKTVLDNAYKLVNKMIIEKATK